MIEKELDMVFGEKFIKEMLLSFIKNKGYLYPALSFDNAAWMVAYRGLTHQSIFGQCVKIGSKLHEVLKAKCKNIKFESGYRKGYVRISSQENTFIDLRTNFLRHRTSGDELEEKIEFEIFTKKGKGDKTSDFPIVYKKNLVVNPVRFTRLTHPKRDNLNRNEKHLKIAEEIMVPIE